MSRSIHASGDHFSVEILEEGSPAGYFAFVDLDFSFSQKAVGFSEIGLGVFHARLSSSRSECPIVR
jgi:hypothetical protein